jgi:hypothetical protein
MVRLIAAKIINGNQARKKHNRDELKKIFHSIVSPISNRMKVIMHSESFQNGKIQNQDCHGLCN